jgi:hypothetical protein
MGDGEVQAIYYICQKCYLMEEQNKKLFEVGIIGMTVVLALLLEVFSKAFGKLILPSLSYDLNLLTQSIFLTQLAIIVILLNVIYVIIYSHNVYKIPFTPLFFFISMLLIILPMNVSSILIRSALDDNQIYNIVATDKFLIYYQYSLGCLAIAFFFIVIYSYLVLRSDKEKKITYIQARTSYSFNISGIIFCIISIIIIHYACYRCLFWASFFTAIGAVIYMVLALLIKLEVRFSLKIALE